MADDDQLWEVTQAEIEAPGGCPEHPAGAPNACDWTPLLETTALAETDPQIDSVLAHIVRHDPARGLREIEAKRRIIAAHEGNHECPSEDDNCGWITDGRRATLRLLALPFADHPDYREEEWAP